jgi:hypothetical protein
MSLRVFEQQSLARGDCSPALQQTHDLSRWDESGASVATCARNDRLARLTADNHLLQPRVRRSRMALERSNVKYRRQEIAAI